MSRRPADPSGTAGETARGMRQLEGYLLWQQKLGQAQRGAERFADRLPWLSGSQRDEVLRQYTADFAAHEAKSVAHTAEQLRSVQGEFTDRYRALRARVLAAALCAVALAVAVAALALAWR